MKKDSLIYYVILFILVLTWLTLFKTIGTDEIEHLHFSFLTGKGLTPYEDYWQHHLPLVWYILSFVSLFPGFFYKLLSIRIIQSIVWIFTVFLIDKYSKRKYSWIITLLFIIAFPYYDYLSIRPEFFALPLIIYILNIYNQKIKPKINFWLILSIILSVFLTPRIYLFVFIFGIYFLYKNSYKTNLNATLILILSLSISFFFFFDLHDIIYFVFVQTREWSCSFRLGYYEYLVLSFHLLGFIICIYQRRVFIVFSYLALFFTFFMEIAPFRNQSTLFLTIMTIYVFSIMIKLKRKHYFFIIPSLIALFLLKTIVSYNRNAPNINYFKFLSSTFFYKNELVDYQNSYNKLNNQYFQTKGFGKNFDKKNDFIHPIFIMNYSYFSFSQPCILENNYRSVIDYNLKRNRKINYFKSIEKLYYINPETKKLFEIIEKYETSEKIFDK